MSVRAKFFVSELTEFAHGSYRVVLRAVTKHGPHDPADNEFFWAATPNGEMSLSLSGTEGKGAFDYFHERKGKDIYIDMIDGDGVYAKCTPEYNSTLRQQVHQPGCPEHDPDVWTKHQESRPNSTQ